MTEEELENRLLRMEALHHIQTADVSALLAVVGEIHKGRSGDEHHLFDPVQSFLRWRNKILRHGLAELEKVNPEKASKWKQIIEDSAINYPFDFDSP